MARTDPQINIRVPAELKKELELLALKNGRSLNAEVVLRLENSIPKKQSQQKYHVNQFTIEAYVQHLTNIMKSSESWDEFKEKLNQPYPPK